MAPTEEVRIYLKDLVEKLGYPESQVNIKELPSAGGNFTSTLYLVDVSGPSKDDLKLFLKVANLSKEFRAEHTEIWSNLFKLEFIFYTSLADNFKVIYDRNNIPKEHRLNIPKCYGSVSEELQEKLVLNNLEAEGYRSYDRKKALSWEYASKAIEQMAKLHSLGFAINKENPKLLENMIGPYERAFYEDEDIVKVCKKQVNLLVEIVQDEYTKKLKQCLVSLDFNKLRQEDKISLIHHDFKPDNLMHRERDGKLDIILCDFQTYRRGNPVIDLLYFIFISSDEEFRKYHYQHLLEYYHSRLTLEVQSLGMDVEEVYPRRVFDQNIKDLLQCMVIFVLGLVPAVNVDPEDAPNITESGVNSFAVKFNTASLEKMHGIVKDLARWNII